MTDRAHRSSEPNLQQVRDTLTRAVRRLMDSRRGLQDSIVLIRQSMRRDGTRGALHGDVLLNRMEHLQRLAVMTGESAVKLAKLGQRLENQPDQAESILQHVLLLCRSVDDQLRTERDDARNLLRLIHQPATQKTA